MHIEKAKEEYEGEFRNDKIHGRGKIVYGNGDTFEGEMVENKKTGRGKYVNKKQGEIQEGVWQLDVRQGEFTELHPNDNIRVVGNYLNGERNGKFIYTKIDTN